MSSSPASPALHVVSTERRLSESIVWQLQRAYFERVGVEAWRDAIVPHYITSNPALARSIAQLCLAMLAGSPETESAQPLLIVELGAGSGRFSYLLLRALCALRAASPWPQRRFRYVATDVAESNLAFLGAHPQLRPFVEEGLLDFAKFDVVTDGTLTLRVSRQTLRPGSCDAPIVVLANYVFDGVPQDAFSFHQGTLHEALVSVLASSREIDPAAGDLFSRLTLRYRRQPAHFDYYPEPAYNRILRDYAQKLDGSTLLFPISALRCIERLSALSRAGMVLIAADRGGLDEASIAERGDPPMHVHGSFSFDVNLHAIGQWFVQQGGLFCKTEHRQLGLPLAAFARGISDAAARALRFAYELTFASGSCDDLFCLRQGIEPHYGKLDVEHLLSLLRLSRFDPRILVYCLPVLQKEAASISAELRRDLIEVVEKVYANHYHIGEKLDLPFELGRLLYALRAPEIALRFFDESLRLYGENAQALWNRSKCLQPDFTQPDGLLQKED